MNIQELHYITEKYEEELLQILKGTVFHVTTKEAFDLIIRSGFVEHNKKQKHDWNQDSEPSFGRGRGWVCLFDLRDATDEHINFTLSRYNFLRPYRFTNYQKDFSESNLVYLILNSKYYPELIPNTVVDHLRTKTDPFHLYIPFTECWYQGNIPIEYFTDVVKVEIRVGVPESLPKALAHYDRYQRQKEEVAE